MFIPISRFSGQTVAFPLIDRPYYEIYEEVVHLYFKEPRNQTKALELLEDACDSVADHRALSCYNLGVFYELSNNPAKAKEAYGRSASIEDNPIFLAAARSLGDVSKKQRADEIHKLITYCKQGQSAEALKIFLRISTNDSFDTWAQPIFANCLAREVEFQKGIAKLKRDTRDFASESIRIKATHTDFVNLWDMELHLRGLVYRQTSRNPITQAWQGIVRAAESGDGGGAAKGIQTLFRLLDKSDEPSKALAIKRGVCALIDQDYIFRRIKRNPAVERLTKPILESVNASE